MYRINFGSQVSNTIGTYKAAVVELRSMRGTLYADLFRIQRRVDGEWCWMEGSKARLGTADRAGV